MTKNRDPEGTPLLFLLGFVLFCLLLSAATGQASIVVENPAPQARNSWVRFTIPEAALGARPFGTYKLGPYDCHLGRETAAGTRMMHANVHLESWERITWPLTRLPSATTSLATPAASATDTGGVPGIRLVVDTNVWDSTLTTSMDGPCLELHLVGRCPNTMMIGEMWIYFYPGDPAPMWELLVVNSDPRTQSMYQSINDLRLEVDGPIVLAPYWPRWKGATQINLNSVKLAGPTTFADSQGVAWAGVAALTASPDSYAALYGPICAVADATTWTGHYGPFGIVPAPPRDEVGYANRLRRWVSYTENWGDPFRPPLLGLAPNSGQTGSQHDFGAAKLGWAWTGGPVHILEAFHSALHEASRPGLWFEADATPVLPWTHPDHITWSGYTHWHSSYSGDRLGKGNQPTPRWSGGYVGPDREHWSNNVLCGTYVLSGSRVIQRIIEKQARQILSGETLDPRLPSTSGVGAPRAIGRTLLAAAWIDCCLDPQSELRAKVRERILARCEQKVEPFTRPAQGAQVSPLGTIEDPRAMNGVKCWSWQEPLGCVGLRAAELRFGSAPARVTLDRALESWLRYGVWHDGSIWKVADYVAFLNGAAPAADSYPTIANPAPVEPPQVVRTEGFEEWSTGALLIAANIFQGELRAKALAVLAQMPPSTVDQAEWMAVR